MSKSKENLKWTNNDIDAAYFLGFMNASLYDKKSMVDALQQEIKRFEELGMGHPWMAIAVLRHKDKP